jgi:hypothetical protein
VPIRLTYDMRGGVITGVIAGEHLELTVQPSLGSVLQWEREQQLRSGAVTLWDHSFELPSKDGGTPIVRRVGSGSTSAPTVHRSPSIAIAGPSGAFYIHGWPPCNLAGCLVVTRGWDALSRALARETEQSVDFFVAR